MGYLDHLRARETAAKKDALKKLSKEGEKRYAYVVPIEDIGDWDWAYEKGYRFRTEFSDDNKGQLYDGNLLKSRKEAIADAKQMAEEMWGNDYQLSIDE